VTGLVQRAAHPQMGVRPRVIMVTSTQDGELKSAFAINFARVATRMGQRVILVDGNLVSPLATRLMGLNPPTNGLQEAMSGKAPFSQSLLRDPRSPALVLSPARRPPNPSQVTASPRMAALFDHMRYGADLVIVDAPAVSQEEAILASLSDAVLFVAPANQTSATIRRALEILAATRAPSVGIVVAHQ
jgi:Mrp family chromosome partitioning ATPase